MFCGKCGNQIEDGSRFCPFCGNVVGTEPGPDINTQQMNTQQTGGASANVSGDSEGGNPLFAMIAGGLFALITLASVITMIVYRSTSVLGIISLIAYIAISFGLLTKRKDVITTGGFALMALVFLISFFRGFATESYTVYTWGWYSSGYHFNFFCMLPTLVMLVGALAAAFIAVTSIGLLPKYKDMSKKLWFLPAALRLGGLILAIIVMIIVNNAVGSWYGGYAYVSVRGILFGIVFAAALLLSMMWLTGFKMQSAGAAPAGATGAGNTGAAGAGTAAYSQGNPYGPVVDKRYCGLIQHILLLSFTFGIWYYIWIYRMTGYTNGIEGEADRIPVRKLLLCMFVPFYLIYWTYKTAKRVDIIARNNGVPSELGSACLFCAIFVAALPPVILQEKMNCIVLQSRNNVR